MPHYVLQIMDGHEAEVSIDAINSHAAVNDGLNALASFACKRFPPPGNISIRISNADGSLIATLGMNFSIEYAPHVTV